MKDEQNQNKETSKELFLIEGKELIGVPESLSGKKDSF